MAQSDKIWKDVAEKSISAGFMTSGVNDTLLEIFKTILTEEQARFIIKVFSEISLNIDQIREITKNNEDLSDDYVNGKLKELMHIGIITGLPSSRTGIMVYRMTPFFPGLLEYTLMRGETGEKQKKIARLWERLGNEGIKRFQSNYEENVSMLNKNFKNIPSDSRIIPVEEEIEAGEEEALPYEAVSKIIDTSSPIGVSTCYCRHRKDLLDKSCEKTDMRVNCLMFGKPAQFCIEQDFAKEITAEEAKKILIESAEAGLIHKTFHSKLDLNREITAICNCCGCCCGGLESLHRGSSPLITVTSYLAQVDLEECTGCEICVEKCQVSAIELIDEKSIINQDHCIGCGQCALNCPSDAIHMERTGLRKVFVPPAKVEIN